MKKINFNLSLFILFIFIIKCASNPALSILENWENTRDEENYWYGISVVSKKSSIKNIQEITRNQAIAEIASQIKININQNFKRVVEEKNYNIEDYSIQILNSRINMNIEDIEIVSFKDSSDSYMVMVRLSKSKYYKNIERKRDNAKTLALDYILKANSPTLASFENLSKAEEIILPYLDYPLYVNYKNQSENIFFLIHSIRDKLIDRILIIPDKKEIVLKNLIGNNQSILISVIDNQTKLPLSSIPLVSILNQNIIECSTDENGECEFFINKLYFTKQINQFYKININRSALYKNKINFDYLDCQIILHLEPINIYFETSETNLGKKLVHPYIGPMLKEYFSSKFYSNFVGNANDCDINIRVNVSTRNNGDEPNDFGVYQTFADATINVRINNQDEPILEISINDIQGADFSSSNQAGHKALQKIQNKIFDETLPELVSILNKN